MKMKLKLLEERYSCVLRKTQESKKVRPSDVPLAEKRRFSKFQIFGIKLESAVGFLNKLSTCIKAIYRAPAGLSKLAHVPDGILTEHSDGILNFSR